MARDSSVGRSDVEQQQGESQPEASMHDRIVPARPPERN